MTQYLKVVYAGREGPSNTRKMEAGREGGREERRGGGDKGKGGREGEGVRGEGLITILWLTYSTVHHLQCTILDLNTKQWFISTRVAHL